MIVHDRSLALRVHHDALSARRINISVTGQDGRSAVLRQTVVAVNVVVGPSDGVGAADSYMVLVARRRQFMSPAAALPDAEEDVVVFLVLVHDGTFLDGEVGRGIADDVLDVRFAAGPRSQLRVVVHFDLLDARPVAAEGEVDR